MDINIRLSNLTPGELALMIPVLEKIQGIQTERQERRAEIKAEVAKEADETPVAVEKPEEAPPLAEVPADEPKASLEDVRAALNKLKTDKGAAAVRDLLGKFEAKRVPDIPEDQYNAVMMAVTEYYGGDEG